MRLACAPTVLTEPSLLSFIERDVSLPTTVGYCNTHEDHPTFVLPSFYYHFTSILHQYTTSMSGECRGSVGRVLDWGSKGCLFEPHHWPQ